MYYAIMQDVGPARTSFVAYLIPPFALVYGVLLADEEIGPGALVGLALILVGSWLATNQRSVGAGRSRPRVMVYPAGPPTSGRCRGDQGRRADPAPAR